MSKANTTLIESMANPRGVDASRVIPSSDDRASFLSKAINRTIIRGMNEVRPPFSEIEVKFLDAEDEYMFRNGAITGMKFYSGEPPLFQPFLIVAVGDRILAGYIRPNSIQFVKIYQ